MYLVQVVPTRYRTVRTVHKNTAAEWKKVEEAATKKREKKKRRRSTTTAVH